MKSKPENNPLKDSFFTNGLDDQTAGLIRNAVGSMLDVLDTSLGLIPREKAYQLCLDQLKRARHRVDAVMRYQIYHHQRIPKADRSSVQGVLDFLEEVCHAISMSKLELLKDGKFSDDL